MKLHNPLVDQFSQVRYDDIDQDRQRPRQRQRDDRSFDGK
jgi:hypothetical protein